MGHSLLGYHDGVESWTVNVASDAGGAHQTFVSHHEAAHHRLHSATPWGLAVIVCGVPDREQVVAAECWVKLLEACQITHEVYATWAAVERTPNGQEFLVGNLLYGGYFRDARYLAELVSDEPMVTSRAVDLLLRLVMAPAALTQMDVALLRSATAALGADETPDARLLTLLERLDGSPLQAALRDALHVAPNARLELTGVMAALDAIELPTMSFAEQAGWTDAIVAELEQEHPGRYVVSAVGRSADLTDALDDQQRERIQMHDAPLPLHILEADADGRFEVTRFTRLADKVGKHVWLTWLAPAFLRRQFNVGAALGSDPVLGLLSCDRVHGAPHSSWFAFPTVPPGLAARAMDSGDTTPLLFTTLRTLEATGDEVDFRGFEPAFVLVDSDIVAFLRRSLDHGQLAWSVIGSQGSRTIDVLIFEQQQVPGIYYLFVCSAPTGRLTAAWLSSRQPPCPADSGRFKDVRPIAWALIEHLLGTFWMFDLHGF